jgi:transposase InsO family protein
VSEWPIPTNVKQLQTFLGFTNFFRRYIPGYACLVQPLLELLRGHGANKSKHQFVKGGSSKRSKKAAQSPVKWEWGVRQQQAFENVKLALLSPPILSYPDFTKKFILHVDACCQGLGAVLYQQHDSGLKVIAYGSKSLSSTENNYSAHKLEFLALKWAVTVKFSHYLYGKAFTDHNPLAYILTTAKLDATGHRWLSELSTYEFQIFYKPGRQNRAADGLSRRPDPEREQQQCTKQISPEIFQEICSLLTNEGFSGFAEILGTKPDAVVNAIPVVQVAPLNWATEQQKDSDLQRVFQLVKSGSRLTDRQRRREAGGAMRLLSHWNSLVIRKNVLYKQSQTNDGVIFRLIVPKHLQPQVLSKSHDDMGHLGRDKTMSVAKERYFWIGLGQSVEQKIQTCPRCVRAKSPSLPERAPLCNIVTTRPLELVCMDFLGLENSKGGHNSILVITDHYTKYACAFPTRNQEAKTVAKILVEQFVVNYGIPKRIHSDQGGCFEGKIIQNMCQMLGMEKSRTTPYHPQGDGITERFNRTLISMLKTLQPSQKCDWKAHVAPLVHAYNCTRHDSTGFTPFFLMFGRTPRLPIDVFLGLPDNYQSTVKSVKDNLEAAYKAATKASQEASKRQAKYYNKKVRGQKIHVGDLVLVRNVGLKGKHKLADKWKQDIHVVVEQPNQDIPVFRVRPENGEGERVLHRNLLLPISLPNMDPITDHLDQGTVTSTQSHRSHSTVVDDSSESESEYVIYEVSDSVPDHVLESVAAVETPVRPQTTVASPVPQSLASSMDGSPATEAPVGSWASLDLELSPLQSTPERVSVAPRGATVVTDGREQVASPQVEVSVEQSPVGHAEGGLGHAGPTDQEQSGSVPLRRSTRQSRRPAYLGDYVSCGQTVQLSNWQLRVHVLLQLLILYPLQQREILNSVLYVITHSC